MSRKTKDGLPFDQYAYMYEWSRENMASISVRFKKEFVQEFKEACKELGLKQSTVFRKAMEETIQKRQKESNIVLREII
ncbi:hypothetical protein AAK899_12405 [Erysipelotrichaceae bacterium 51-3]